MKFEDNHVRVSVRVARPSSYVWCGMVEAGRTGRVLKVNLTPDLLKKYGVRSPNPTEAANEVVQVEIKNVLKPDTDYDLYCHSEVSGQTEAELTPEQLREEIAASRMRISTDMKPPVLSDIGVETTYQHVNVTFAVNESATVYCVALKVPEGGSSELGVLFGPSGALEVSCGL